MNIRFKRVYSLRCAFLCSMVMLKTIKLFFLPRKNIPFFLLNPSGNLNYSVVFGFLKSDFFSFTRYLYEFSKGIKSNWHADSKYFLESVEKQRKIMYGDKKPAHKPAVPLELRLKDGEYSGSYSDYKYDREVGNI